MSLEQTDFLGKFDDSDSSNATETQENTEENSPNNSSKESKIQKPDDGLSFNCEVCQDVTGGCPSCGFGRNQ